MIPSGPALGKIATEHCVIGKAFLHQFKRNLKQLPCPLIQVHQERPIPMTWTRVIGKTYAWTWDKREDFFNASITFAPMVPLEIPNQIS